MEALQVRKENKRLALAGSLESDDIEIFKNIIN